MPGLTTLPRLYTLDARLAYASCMSGMESGGTPVHDDRPEFEPHRPGFYCADITVPADWAHLGVLPVKQDGGGWRWPSVPGERFTSWASEPEVRLAVERGWGVDIRQRILLTPQTASANRPLELVGKKLLGIRARAESNGDVLVAQAVRAIILQGIGGLYRGARDRDILVGSDGSLPAYVNPGDIVARSRTPDGGYVITHRGALTDWSAARSHPELAALVWGGWRRRLLSHRDGTGALNPQRETLVAVMVDALYVTVDPGWVDNGRPGAWRVKETIPGPLSVPHSISDIHALKRRGRT
jgi:hypothetical protein